MNRIGDNPAQHASEVQRLRDEVQQLRRDLHASTMRFQNILAHSSDGVLIVDRGGLVCFANPAAQKLLDRSTAGLIGEPFGFPVAPDVTAEIVVPRSDAGAATVEQRVAETVWDGALAYLVTLRDITERKRAETERERLEDERRWLLACEQAARLETEAAQRAHDDSLAALRESEERFRHAILNAPFPIMIHAEDGAVIQVNCAWTAITGYSAQDIPTIAEWTRRAYGQRNSEIRNHIDQLYRLEHQVDEGDYIITTRAGERRIWAFSSAPLGALFDGRRLVISMAMDVTERRRAEAQIQCLNAELERRVAERTAALEAANRDLESFSYSVSHDLRAPLRRIDGFSQALLEDYGDRLGAEGLDYLRRVRAACQHMGQLIDDMLNLARLARSDMASDDVDLSALAQSIAEACRQAHPEREVDLRIALGLVARGDARLLGIALENLLANAWKFTARRPHAQIEFGATEREGRTIYFVRDNGAGFDMAYADKLFGVFQRLHAPADFEGTGIGLATVKRIIQRHGGEIWAEGAPDRGATFFFTIGEQR